MTNTLQRLEARGLVRIEADAGDGRAKQVFLTDAGRARRNEAVASAAAELEPVAAQMGTRPEALLPGLRALRTGLDRARN